MDNLLKNKKTIMFCVFMLIISVFIYIVVNRDDKVELLYESDNNLTYLKNYKVNEYIPVYIEEADMVIKYLNDFKNSMINNVEYSYNLLNKKYREKRFGSLDNYVKYINNILSTSTFTMEVDVYKVIRDGKYKYFDVYDINGNHYIFKELSIMNYEVFLDNYTVEIK